MGILAWGGKILFRRAHGSRIAADPACCCVECVEECIPCPVDCGDCCQTYAGSLTNPLAWFPVVPAFSLPHSAYTECSWTHGNNIAGDPSLTYGVWINCVEDDDGCGQWMLHAYFTGSDGSGNWIYWDGSVSLGTSDCPPTSGSFTLQPQAGSIPADYTPTFDLECND